MDQIPLNYEASEGDTHKQTTTTLPSEVVQCLENARFLHLATCTDNVPHVSLMNYTYLPSSPYSNAPVIVMTTNPASRKMTNLVANPNVSLLGLHTDHRRKIAVPPAAPRVPNTAPVSPPFS
ncbi:Fc.00g040720.m01.CDS01 [Cosmosporella sp. VM-42]